MHFILRVRDNFFLFSHFPIPFPILAPSCKSCLLDFIKFSGYCSIPMHPQPPQHPLKMPLLMCSRSTPASHLPEACSVVHYKITNGSKAGVGGGGKPCKVICVDLDFCLVFKETKTNLALSLHWQLWDETFPLLRSV